MSRNTWVYFMDKDGVMHPMSFPPEDSDHERLSHFYINSMTGKPFEEISPEMRRFPVEKAAMILARELVQQGKATEAKAMEEARRIFNEATMRFNKIKRENGDDFHTLPIPFDDDGQLHPEYRNNHYGAHQSRRVPTSQRQTRTEDGKLINNHTNNKAHPTLGVHLESAALHIHKELLEELEIYKDMLKYGRVNKTIPKYELIEAIKETKEKLERLGYKDNE